MNNSIIVTLSDYDRLKGLTGTSPEKFRTPEIAMLLAERLSAAKTLPSHDIDRTVVTMNSRVHLKDLNSNRETEVTITYPSEADPREKRISVLSPIGIALLGGREKDIVSWKVPGGIGRFQILKVTYQPEAAGHYDL